MNNTKKTPTGHTPRKGPLRWKTELLETLFAARHALPAYYVKATLPRLISEIRDLRRNVF